jgi:hypothetical protein
MRRKDFVQKVLRGGGLPRKIGITGGARLRLLQVSATGR